MPTPSHKRCPRCCSPGDVLPASAFSPNRARYDGLQSICRACFRDAHRAYHARDGAVRRTRVRDLSAAARERNRAKLMDYLLGRACQDCGIDNPIVLEFHHVADKERSVVELVTRGYRWDRVREEIDRCIVLCANCHRIRTATAGNHYRARATARLETATGSIAAALDRSRRDDDPRSDSTR